MTEVQVKELLKKVEMLEAKATILQEEAASIKIMLQDIVDPENKKAQAIFEKNRQKAVLEASVNAHVKRHMAWRKELFEKRRIKREQETALQK